MAGQDIEVVLDWSEDVSYRSTVKIDRGHWRDWLVERDLDPDTEPTDRLVMEYFASGPDDTEWFDQTDTTRDYEATTRRTIEGVQVPVRLR